MKNSFALLCASILCALLLPYWGAHSQEAVRAPGSAPHPKDLLRLLSDTPAGLAAPEQSEITLTSGIAQSGSISAPSPGSAVLGATQYVIGVPSNATQLRVDLNGTPDVDLFIRFSQRITIVNGRPVFDYVSDSTSGNETITVTASSAPPLRAGNYYIAVANFGPGAANFNVTATVTVSPGPTPTPCHSVSNLNPSIGVIGSSVTLNGTNLTGVNAVRFSNNVAAQFSVNAAGTQITATVPAGAATGALTLSKPNCPDVTTGVFTVTTTPPPPPTGELAVDDGSFEDALGLRTNDTLWAVNRLTPTSYPATLSAVAIYFLSGSNLATTKSFNLRVAANPSGNANISGVNFQSPVGVTVQALGQFNVYPLTNPLTINSGDFVVGFSINDAMNTFPFTQDKSSPSQRRSYVSLDGATFLLMDDVGPEFAGNLAIRARLATTGQPPCPTITNLAPTSGQVGSTVTITGANLSGVTVKFTNNITAQSTVNGAGTQISATVPAGAVTGPLTLSKTGCADVQTVPFTVTTCTYAITPTSQSFTASAGTGSVNVTTGSACNWTATSNASFVTITAGGSGTGNGAVNYSVAANPGTTARSGTLTIAGQTFTVTQAGATTTSPVLTSLEPASKPAGSAGFTLTINGSGFIPGSQLKWNGVDRLTNYINTARLTVDVPASDVAAPGGATITVVNPGSSPSNALTFSITQPMVNPMPTLSSLNPSMAPAGGAGFTLTVTGADFINSSVVRWNGDQRTTTFVSATQLTAAIPASDLATAGTVSVTVFTPAPGGGASGALTFTITPVPSARVVRVVSGGAAVGGQAQVFIELVADGTENGLSFSLLFDPAVLSNPLASPGTGALSATLLTNTSQVTQGRLGVSLTQPPNQTFPAGVRQLLVVTFSLASGATSGSTALSFGDQPVLREVVDANANRLPASFVNGQVTLTPSGYEADVSPRPNGDNNGTVTLSDYVQVGRFAVGLDPAAVGSEFQRADCAPRETLGNGVISLADYVQAGRYAVGLDPVTPAGGPTAPSASAQPLTSLLRAPFAQPIGAAEPRLIGALSRAFAAGQSNVLAIEMAAQGRENALGFSLNFDPQRWRLAAVSVGRDAKHARLQLNTSQTGAGRLGLALTLPPGETLKAGQREVVRVSFAPLATAPSSDLKLGFSDEPVAREVVDAEANSLPAFFVTELAALGLGALVNGEAADFGASGLTRATLVTAYGANLAVTTAAADNFPWPTSLAGTLVRISDSAGVEHPAPLVAVSPEQVKYLIPAGVALGLAQVTIISGDGAVSVGEVLIVERTASSSPPQRNKRAPLRH